MIGETMAIPLTTRTKLHRWMRATCTTQEELARRLKVTQPTVSRILSGRRPINLDVALRLTEITGLPISYLARLNRRAA
jgi:transcriptional regulator with XRE-family HTH domain